MRALRYQAAGGVVVDGERVLVLLRPSRDEVRLPKGHIEAGEAPLQTALREVVEESGYADLELAADLGMQVVEFDFRDAHIVRDERYFALRLVGPRQVARAPKELQFEPVWMSWQDAAQALTYAAEREWLERARAALEGTETPGRTSS
ncbi:MAG: NUDIX domain-containing protein [Anaerolineae bacterium]|nr:NUDIX domain-containing protein [Anaerolineae bacterium]